MLPSLWKLFVYETVFEVINDLCAKLFIAYIQTKLHHISLVESFNYLIQKHDT